jgi:cupin fold WbuC family metalloprotein
MLLTEKTLLSLRQQALESPRQRAHLNLHASFDEPVQKLVISMLPTSYVRPHSHWLSKKSELLIVVEGSLDLLLFSASGHLKQRHTLSANSPQFGIELKCDQWHSLVCEQPVTFIEIKQGPYIATVEQEFACWAPAEADTESAHFLAQLKHCRLGQKIV